jgi:amino acid transporter
MAAMIVAAAQIGNPEYQPHIWHNYLIFLLILVIQGYLATRTTRVLGQLNAIGTAINMFVLIIFIFWVPAAAVASPKFNDNNTVWVALENRTEWPLGWSFMMSFLAVVWTMSGM